MCPRSVNVQRSSRNRISQKQIEQSKKFFDDPFDLPLPRAGASKPGGMFFRLLLLMLLFLLELAVLVWFSIDNVAIDTGHKAL